uniref:THAP-type domain-containing protein n=1 Tax=Nothobranchius furzeri TaxID=105023 RepID=A0A8C6PVN3_NOTFU
MPVTCVAKGCENKPKAFCTRIFHVIPTDVEWRRAWFDAVGLPETPILENKRYMVCEEHLTKEDYFEKIQHSTQTMVRRLEKMAAPSLFCKQPKDENNWQRKCY